MSRTRGIVEYSCSQVPEERSMSREYVYFLSHAPTGSLCSFPSISDLISMGQYNKEVSSEEEKLSSKPAPNLASPFFIPRPYDTWRRLRPLSLYLGHTTLATIHLNILCVCFRTRLANLPWVWGCALAWAISSFYLKLSNVVVHIPLKRNIK